MTNTKNDKITELLTRGVAQVLPERAALERLLKERKIRLYLGVDPTGAKLHLGHAIALRKLQQFAELGHEAFLIVGTGTVLAGDPSQRAKARTKITNQEIKSNIRSWRAQVAKVVDLTKIKIVRNGDWLTKLKLPEILNIASNLSATQLFR